MRQRNELTPGNTIFIDQFMAVSGTVDKWLKALQILENDKKLVVIPTITVYSDTHLISAFRKAWRAVFRKENRAKDHSIEVLRWLTGSRQVSTTLDLLKVELPQRYLVASMPVGFGSVDPEGIEVFVERHILRVEEGAGLETIEGEIIWGKDQVRTVYSDLADIEDDELEWAVLEKVALTDI